MSEDLFSLPSAKLVKITKWEESKHPRDDKGRWASIEGAVVREAGSAAVSAGVTALLGAAPGLFNVARSARNLGAAGRGTRREAFIAPYRQLVRAVRRRVG